MFKRSFWGLVDQVVNSFSSLLLAVMVARVSSPEEVGGWAVGYAIYTFVLTVSRNSVSTTALISEAGEGVTRSQTNRGAASLCLLFGVAAGFPMVAGGLIIGGTVGGFVVLFGAGLPILLAQDSVRYILIRASRPHLTAAMDVLWLAIQIALGLGMSVLDRPGQNVVLAWLVGAILSGFLGLCLVGWVFSIAAARQFFHAHRTTASKLLLDSLLGAGTANILPLLLGAILGLAATGYFRGALTLLGVAGILVMGLTPIATVEVLRRAGDRRFSSAFLWLWSALLAGLGILLFVAFRFLPDRVGEQLLGDTWQGTKSILFAMSLQVVLRGPFTGVPIVLRAAHRLDAVIRLRIANSFVTLSVITLGATVFGLNGAAWAWAISALVTSVIAIGFYRNYLRDGLD